MFNKKFGKRLRCVEEDLRKLNDEVYKIKADDGVIALVQRYKNRVNKNNERSALEFFDRNKSSKPDFEEVSFDGFVEFLDGLDSDDADRQIQNILLRLRSVF
tara:strand:- start:188 stop:493 length:306 start_codon:yes stop_codon:yes gene_type:complete